MRTEEIASSTRRTRKNALRPRRPKVVFDRMMKTTTVVRPKVAPIKWQEARRRGEAYGRALDGHPWGKWPPSEVLAKQKDHNIKMAEIRKAGIKKVRRYKRDPRGEWWASHLADVIDRRAVRTTPKYRARAGRRKKVK
jgi:hypothetical protein